MATPYNEERLQKAAQDRYGLDLQGALRRAMVTSGSPQHSRKDINGICRGAYGLERAAANSSMFTTLTTAPAP